MWRTRTKRKWLRERHVIAQDRDIKAKLSQSHDQKRSFISAIKQKKETKKKKKSKGQKQKQTDTLKTNFTTSKKKNHKPK